MSQGRRKAEFWHQMQNDLVGLSHAGERVVVENSGHFVHHDNPALVIETIRGVVDQARSD